MQARNNEISRIVRSVIEAKAEEGRIELENSPLNRLPADTLTLLRVAKEFQLIDVIESIRQRGFEILCARLESVENRSLIKLKEKRLEDYLSLDQNLFRVRPGLRYLGRQEILESGRTDIVAMDGDGTRVIVELKARDYRPSEVANQLRKYLGECPQDEAIFVAPRIDPSLFYAVRDLHSSGRLSFVRVTEIREGQSYNFDSVAQPDADRRQKSGTRSLKSNGAIVIGGLSSESLARIPRSGRAGRAEEFLLGKAALNREIVRRSESGDVVISKRDFLSLKAEFMTAAGSDDAVNARREMNSLRMGEYMYLEKSDDVTLVSLLRIGDVYRSARLSPAPGLLIPTSAYLHPRDPLFREQVASGELVIRYDQNSIVADFNFDHEIFFISRRSLTQFNELVKATLLEGTSARDAFGSEISGEYSARGGLRFDLYNLCKLLKSSWKLPSPNVGIPGLPENCAQLRCLSNCLFCFDKELTLVRTYRLSSDELRKYGLTFLLEKKRYEKYGWREHMARIQDED